MHSAQSQVSIPVMLGDTGRTLRINLSDGSNPYVIADGCLAKLTITRPTGTRLEEFCTIENNTTIVYHFSQNQNTCAVEGIHNCDVTLYGLDGKVITSPRFSMVVSERVVKSDDIVLADKDLTAVDAMLAKEAERQIAEAERVAEFNANEAERIATFNAYETEAKASEAERVTNEEARQNAEAERIANEEARQKNAEAFSAEVVERVLATLPYAEGGSF